MLRGCCITKETRLEEKFNGDKRFTIALPLGWFTGHRGQTLNFAFVELFTISHLSKCEFVDGETEEKGRESQAH